MKRRTKISVTLLMLIFSLLISLNLSAEVVTTYILGDGGTLQWNYEVGELCACPINGNNCKITVTKKSLTESITPVESGGWTLHGDLDELEAEITPEVGGSFTQNISTSNYAFVNGSTVKILVCDEHPILVGRVIDLSGITTDNNGQFEVFIPEE